MVDIITGQFQHSLDSKGRLKIPAKLLPKLGNNIFISNGTDGCLEIRSEQAFVETHNKYVSNASHKNKQQRSIERVFFSGSSNVSVDNAGRVLIPWGNLQYLSKLDEDKKVMLVGVNDHLEVWVLQDWEEYLCSETKVYEDNIEDYVSKHE